MKPGVRVFVLLSVVFGAAIVASGIASASTSSNDSVRAAAASPAQRTDLETLHRRMLPLFELDGLVFTDADEARGRLVVGVSNRGLATAVQARLKVLGIDPQLVDIKETAPIVELTSLRDQVADIAGGVEINFVKMPWLYACTLGFNAVRAGQAGFVTNSHCTKTRGQVDGTQYYQTYASGRLIGTEIADPGFVSDPACPRKKKCSYADVAFATRAAGLDAAMGSIEKTTGPNNGSLNISGSFTITDTGAALKGDTVNKVGRTTGWTQGNVTATCANVGVQGSNIVMLCQDMVSAQVAGGDSGSPVFKITSGDDVTLLGILWGGSNTDFVYSPYANIVRSEELGLLCVKAGC